MSFLNIFFVKIIIKETFLIDFNLLLKILASNVSIKLSSKIFNDFST